jgi:serine/threonine protein kinase
MPHPKWYRAPEQLLKLQTYGPPADIWATGATLAEILTQNPLFPGKSEQDQLRLIFSSRGHPALVGWREGAKAATKIDPRFPRVTTSSLSSSLPNVSHPVLQLIEDMLLLDPRSRPSAALALEYPLFRLHPDVNHNPEHGNRPSRATTADLSSRANSPRGSPVLQWSRQSRLVLSSTRTEAAGATSHFQIPSMNLGSVHHVDTTGSNTSRRVRSPAGTFDMSLRKRSPRLHQDQILRHSKSVRTDV